MCNVSVVKCVCPLFSFSSRSLLCVCVVLLPSSLGDPAIETATNRRAYIFIYLYKISDDDEFSCEREIELSTIVTAAPLFTLRLSALPRYWKPDGTCFIFFSSFYTAAKRNRFPSSP